MNLIYQIHICMSTLDRSKLHEVLRSSFIPDMALAFDPPLATDFILSNPAYDTPAWSLNDVQDLLDYCYEAYPTIACLKPNLQPMAFRLAVAHEAESLVTMRQGYGGVVKSIKNRNDSIEFSLSKEGWNLANSLAGSRLLKLLNANCGNGLYSGAHENDCAQSCGCRTVD